MMEGEIVTLRGKREYRHSRSLELVTGTFDPDGSVALWIQEWKPRFQITPLRVRHGDSFRATGYRIRVVELNAHNVRPYVTLEIVAEGMESLLPDRAATHLSSQPTIM